MAIQNDQYRNSWIVKFKAQKVPKNSQSQSNDSWQEAAVPTAG